MLVLALVLINVRDATTLATSTPKCYAYIMSLYKWCEQSECQKSCACSTGQTVCKQICSYARCSKLHCESSKTCYQTLLANEDVDRPSVGRMVSHAPEAKQDCTRGTCDLIQAKRYKDTLTKSFQSCSEGYCKDMRSDADHAKQFCGRCDRMACEGEHATNCTQLCVVGACKNMYCNARHCKQICAHESGCNMTCGPNAVTCEQTCSHYSKCSMTCQGRRCKQNCKRNQECSVRRIPHTTTTTTTSTTEKKTELSTTPTYVEVVALRDLESRSVSAEPRDYDSSVTDYDTSSAALKSNSCVLKATSWLILTLLVSYLI